MPKLFDLHAKSERLAVWTSDPDGRYKIELCTLQGETLGEIAADFLPLEPQWSPDGATVAFGRNDGLLYLHQLGETDQKVVFANPALQAGFCEWAGDGNHLVFSAYDKALHTPPNLYCLALDTGHTFQLTDDANTVDRFPHWSPSGQWVAFQRQFLDEPELPRRKVRGFRVDANPEGKALVRVSSFGQGYRVADFREEVFLLDESGEATESRMAASSPER